MSYFVRHLPTISKWIAHSLVRDFKLLGNRRKEFVLQVEAFEFAKRYSKAIDILANE